MTFWVAGAIGGSAIISALGSNNAANTQAQGQQQAAQTQQNMFNTINAQEQPYWNAGVGATNALNDLVGTTGTPGAISKATGLPNGYLTQQFNPTQDQLNNYPGYQFALQTGGQAVRNADTPGSGALSGSALKDLTNFNVGTANQYYGQYFNQFQQQQNSIFSRLSAIAGLGQNAASNVGNNGAQLGKGIAEAQAASAGSQAAGQVGVANSLSSAAVPLSYLLSGQNSSGGNGSEVFNGISPTSGGAGDIYSLTGS